jgi:hypothetical protein
MTESDSEVEPLFRPGPELSKNPRFICNIGDELSLWSVGWSPTLRIYAEDNHGIWLESEEKVRAHVDRLNEINAKNTVQCLSAIARNYEAIRVYMQMLGVKP